MQVDPGIGALATHGTTGLSRLSVGEGLAGLAVCWFVAFLFLLLWRSQSRFIRLLRDVPTVPVRGVFVGLTETAGSVVHPDPLKAGITGTPCVHHAWSVREYWTRTETYRDSKGKTRTRTVHGSDVVDGGSQSTDFVLQDETGRIVVRHSGAGWTAMTTFDRTVGRGDPLYGSKAPDRTVRGSTGRRTFHESAVPVGVKAWIMGNAHVGPSGDALEIGSGGEEGVFLVSLTGEASHGTGARVLAVLAWIVACGAAVLGGVGLAPLIIATTGIPEGPAVAVGLGFGILSWTMASTLTWAFMVRNGAVRVRQRWERAASLVDVELKRRADLIPGLVTVTRAAAAHEALVQRAVAELRAGAASHGILRVLAERYPALTADAAFLRLQRELAETEARIAQSRTFEIQSRERLLERLQTVPEGLVAAVMGVAKPPPALDAPAPPPSSPARPPRG